MDTDQTAQLLDSLLEYVRLHRRVCPNPGRWSDLYKLLPAQQNEQGEWQPAAPLILGAWWTTPPFFKMVRLAEHIRYAASHGVLTEVDTFLRGLPEESWTHFGEI